MPDSTSQMILSSVQRGALFGALLLAIEEAANFAVGQPALSLPEVGTVLGYYVAALAVVGLLLAKLRSADTHLLAMLGLTGGFMAGGKLAEELWWGGLSQQEACAVGYPVAMGVALGVWWLTVRLTRERLSVLRGLTWAGLVFIPAFRALNINAYGSPLTPEALTADGVILCVAAVVGAGLARWGTCFDARPGRYLSGAAVLIGGVTLVGRVATAPTLPGPATAQDKPDVLLVIIDTLRADHVGSYGYNEPTTPNLDTMAHDGLRYSQVASSASWTLPSFGSFVTGRYPYGHGAGLNDGEKNTQSGLDEDVPTLAERMRDAGYRTGAIVTNPYLKDSFGISRGFDTYSDALGLAHMPMFVQPLRMLSIPVMGGRYFYRPADVMVDEAVDWWAAMEGGPRFLMLHLMDPHDPYNPPEQDVLATAASNHEDEDENAYDAEIHFTDRELGRILGAVDQRTLVIVTSDHGDTFGEHPDPYPDEKWPFTRHGHTLYQELLHVPLLIQGPSVEPGVEDRPVRALDVVPTILKFVGAEPLETHGEPLWEMFGQEAPNEPGAVGAQAMRFGTEKRAVRVGPYKLIRTQGGDELYDLVADPEERRNRAEELPEQVTALADKLPVERDATEASSIDEETKRQLESLGYVQ